MFEKLFGDILTLGDKKTYDAFNVSRFMTNVFRYQQF